MSAEAVSEAAGQGLLDQVLIGLIVDACSYTAQRVIRHVAQTATRSGKSLSAAEYLSIDLSQFVPTTPGLALLPSLPTDAQTAQKSLQSPASRTVIRQIAAASFLDEHASYAEDFAQLLQQAFAEQDVTLNTRDAASLVEAIHSVSANLVGQIKTSAEASIIAEQAARTVLMQATLESIRQDVSLMEGRRTRNQAQDSEWLTRFRAQCARRHGYITPPDNNRRTTVPLEDIYVPGRLKGVPGREHEPETVLDLAESLDRHVILGDPGGGKSTATNAIAHLLSTDANGSLPFVVVLRDYGKTMSEESIASFIERTVSARYEIPAPPAGLIEHSLRHGKATVLLDGLDELLDSTKRRSMAEKVELFSRSYPSASLLVTSRRVGYAEAQLDPRSFHPLELGSHTAADVENYTTKWFNLNASELQMDEGVTVEDVVSAFLRESASIADLRSNPLLLALLCIIYRGQNYLPRNRIGIYEKCTELLFTTWDRSRGLKYDFTFDSYLDDALKHLALWMFVNSDQDAGVTETELVAEIAAFFAEEAYETTEKSTAAAKSFIGFCRGRAWVLAEAGLTPDGVPLFTFAHRTFMEYYAAAQLNRKYPEPEKLAMQLVTRVSRNEWDTVGQLAIQIMNRSVIKGAERAIAKMISFSHANGRTFSYRANTLFFVGRCLTDLPPAPGLLRLAFPRFTALVESYYATPSFQVSTVELETAIGSLYRQDAGGEAILLSELRTYMTDALNSGVRRRFWAALFVARCCLDRQHLSKDERKLFEDSFITPWLTREPREYETLKTAYFMGILSLSDISEKSTSVGDHLLDPWLQNTVVSDPVPHDFYYSLIFPMISFSSLWPDSAIETFDSRPARWFGTLSSELGAALRNSSSGALASGGLVDTASARVNLPHVRTVRSQISVDRRVTALVAACVLTEEFERESEDRVEESFGNPAIDEAIRARATGAWQDSGYFASIDSGWPIYRRLQDWAARRDRFTEAV